jgi:cation diffusion facilitator CzcD-associated flavoprotein CzcO
MTTPIVEHDDHQRDVVVVGGGQAGLAVGYFLKRHPTSAVDGHARGLVEP